MKHETRKFKSRKARKKALHLRQYGSTNSAPSSTQAKRMIAGSGFTDIAKAIMSMRRGGGDR